MRLIRFFVVVVLVIYIVTWQIVIGKQEKKEFTMVYPVLACALHPHPRPGV